MVTDKNKEQFFNYYRDNFMHKYKITWKAFNESPFEMQIGVYLAYYDSFGIIVETEFDHVSTKSVNYGWQYWINGDGDFKEYTTRNEAYKEAFKKANEIANNSIK